MTLIALIVGIVLIVAAIRGTEGALFGALLTDVPGFAVWGAALFAVGAVGFIPGLKPVSRGILALVILVILVNNYQTIINGFQGVAKGQANPTPTTPDSPQHTTSGGGGGSSSFSLSDFAHSAEGAAELAAVFA